MDKFIKFCLCVIVGGFALILALAVLCAIAAPIAIAIAGG